MSASSTLAVSARGSSMIVTLSDETAFSDGNSDCFYSPSAMGAAEAIGELAAKLFRSPSRLSAPGPIAGRAEHWIPLAADDASEVVFAQLLTRIAFGNVPCRYTRCIQGLHHCCA